MSRFVLRPAEGTCTYQKIVSGKKWIGRVYKVADGSFSALINTTSGRDEVSGFDTAYNAFAAVVAKTCGHASPEAMQQHNRNVRAANAHGRAIARHAADEMLRGNFAPFERLFLKD